MMSDFIEIAADGTGARFELRMRDYIKRRWKKKEIKKSVWVEISTEQWVNVPTRVRTVQLVRPMTEDDKLRWPDAWAEFERQHDE